MDLKNDALPSYNDFTLGTYARLYDVKRPSSQTVGTSNCPHIGKVHQTSSDNITLKVQSHLKTELPVFEAGSEVAGIVFIGKPQKVEDVSILLKGKSESSKLITIASGTTTFQIKEKWIVLNDEKVLWSSRNGGELTESEELCQFPFSFKLPTSGTYVRLDDKNNVTDDQVPYEMLPPSMDLDMHSVKYHLKVQVTRSGVRSNNVLKFLILVSPTLPIAKRSKLCVEAMSHGLPPPTPELDPNGWSTMTDEVLVKSTFGKTLGKLSAQFSTPSPPIYISSVPIPFVLNLHFDEGDKDDKIIKDIQINLIRCIQAKIRQGGDNKSSKITSKGEFHKIAFDQNVFESTEDIKRQINFHLRDGRKNFSGEIFARTKGAPSFETPNIKVSWMIEVVLSTPGFRRNHKMEIPIEIAPNAEFFEMPKCYSDDSEDD